MNHTEEQVKDIQSRIDIASAKIAEILKENELSIAGKIIKGEIAPGVFADSVQIGYTDTKYLPKKEEEKVLKED